MKEITVLVGLLFLASTAFAAAPRNSQARAAFVKENPCPATGKSRGACPGYVVDHVRPLCADGPDHASNMQWQIAAEAKIKDVEERRQCAVLRRK